MRNPVLEKFSLMSGVLAFMAAMFLFQVNFPALNPVQKAVLCGHLVVAMAACGIVGGRRALLGLVVLPLIVFGVTSLTCWWIVSSR